MGGGEVGGGTRIRPQTLPNWSPQGICPVGPRKTCEIPEGPGRRGLGAAGEGWGLTASHPSVRPSVPPGHRLNLDSPPFLQRAVAPLSGRGGTSAPPAPCSRGHALECTLSYAAPIWAPGCSSHWALGLGACSVLPLHCFPPQAPPIPLLPSTS